MPARTVIMRSSLAWILLAATLSLCLASSGVQGTQADEPAVDPVYRCDAIDRVPPAEQCAFVTRDCSGGSRVPYAVWYYCKVSPVGLAAKFLFVMAMILALPLFFCLLGDTAEVFFSPTMAHVSQSIPWMKPRFAGVTLVALGNGAPDLFANMASIRNGEIPLSVGALTGAAMFVQCIVASEVIRIAGGVNCRGATVRDVAIYLVSVLGVLAAFYSGTVSYLFAAGCFCVYAIYVIWVGFGDWWHANGRKRPSWEAIKAALGPGDRSALDDEEARHGLLPWAAVDPGEQVQGSEHSRGGVKHSSRSLISPFGASFMQSRPSGLVRGSYNPLHSQAHLARYHTRLDARSYQDMVWADLSDDPLALLSSAASRRLTGGPTAAGEGGASFTSGGHDVELHQSAQHPAGYVPPAVMEEGLGAEGPAAPYAPTPAHEDHSHGRPAGVHRRLSFGSDVEDLAEEGRAGASGSSPGGGSESGGGVGGTGGDAAGLSPVEEGLPFAEEERGLSASSAGDGGSGWWWEIKRELTIGTCHEWAGYSTARRRFRAVTFPLLLPVYLALRCTIPFVDPAGYSQQWLVVTSLFGPLAVATYFNLASDPYPLAIALIAGVVFAGMVHVLTRDDVEALPPFDLGTSFDFGPAFFSCLGFGMGMIWIDTLASEVVGMLSLLAQLCSIPAALMGLSLMAVGNSLGDLFGDMALARRGMSSMALTACIASPLFNMLLSLAFGFYKYFRKNGVHSVQVTLPNEVAVGGVFLVTYNVALLAVGLFHGGRLPARWYLFARSWYILYLACAVAAGIVGVAQGEGQ